jgi:hypothetical protein
MSLLFSRKRVIGRGHFRATLRRKHEGLFEERPRRKDDGE